MRTASTCDAALRQLEEAGSDVVVTDYALPGSGTGYQLLRRIRAQPVDAHVPVVGYSAHAEMVPAYEQTAFTAYVPKPAVSGSLIEILSGLVRRRR